MDNRAGRRSRIQKYYAANLRETDFEAAADIRPGIDAIEEAHVEHRLYANTQGGESTELNAASHAIIGGNPQARQIFGACDKPGTAARHMPLAPTLMLRLED